MNKRGCKKGFLGALALAFGYIHDIKRIHCIKLPDIKIIYF